MVTGFIFMKGIMEEFNMEILKKLFCKHNYIKIGFREDETHSIRYSIRHYKCSKCKKEIWVDGRYDMQLF